MGIKIQVSADRSRKSSMMLADVPRLKQLSEYDFLHKTDQAGNKNVQSTVIFFLKKIKQCAHKKIYNEIIHLIHIKKYKINTCDG